MNRAGTSLGIIAIAWSCAAAGCTTSNDNVKEDPNTNPDNGPPAGNPDGTCAIPADAQAEDTSKPDHVVGNGTPGG